ncbi:hypothetical protein TNCT_379661 [Trichonephila clavata]|uniref:Uncharacterized protein n=1 Tax=Trichonephila clavata TaxID=2740835 RepID=A0A8X6LK05_TRICU|nr:hypothetical protein TNCT_379661 [Trichonephila clavata]
MSFGFLTLPVTLPSEKLSHVARLFEEEACLSSFPFKHTLLSIHPWKRRIISVSGFEKVWNRSRTFYGRPDRLSGDSRKMVSIFLSQARGVSVTPADADIRRCPLQ